MTVSVILPTYNRANLVGEAIESVLGQTHRDFQLIVVDDGSTDETPAVLARFADPRLRIIRQDNGGKSAARNRGLDEARGEFIAFLDSDDLWAPTFLESVLAVFSGEPELDFVFSDLIRFDESGFKDQTQFEIVPQVRGFASRPSASGTGRVLLDPPFPVLVPLTQFVTWLQCVVIKTDRIGNVRFPPNKPLGQDYTFMLRVYAATARCGYVDEPLAFIRRHGGNSYFRAPPDMLPPHAFPALDTLLTFDDRGIGKCEKRALAIRTGTQLRYIGRFHFWNRHPLRAAPFFLRALRYPGSRARGLLYLMALPISPVSRRRLRAEEWGD